MMTISMEDLFDRIHKMQAENMVHLLERGEVTAAEMNAINKFLSDNSITGIRGQNKALKKLSDGLAAFEEGSNITQFHKEGR